MTGTFHETCSGRGDGGLEQDVLAVLCIPLPLSKKREASQHLQWQPLNGTTAFWQRFSTYNARRPEALYSGELFPQKTDVSECVKTHHQNDHIENTPLAYLK